MAAAPAPSSELSHSSGDGDTQSSSTRSYGQVDGEQAHFAYQDGALSWGASTIQSDDIITVTAVSGVSDAYEILSLAPEEGTKFTSSDLRTTKATKLPEAFLAQYLSKSLPSYLKPENDIYILVSTLSGTGLSPVFFDNVLQPLLRGIGLAESQYEVLHTTSAESVKAFTRSDLLSQANEGRKQTVLVLSGDGGMVDIINGLLEDEERSSKYVKPVICLLPLGTGNALFHSLHKPSPLPSIYIQGLRTLFHGAPKPLPTLCASFSPSARLLTDEGRKETALKNGKLYGAVVASYGLHSTLVADSDTTEYRKHGDKRFGLVAKELLFADDGSPPHKYQARVTLSKEGWQEDLAALDHGYILATLVSNLEKTFTISPASRPLDGVLRVVSFSALSGNEAMGVMTAAYDGGKHVDLPEVRYDAVDSLKIQFLEKGATAKWRRCCIDGSIVAVGVDGWMEVSLVKPGQEAVDVVADL